MMINSVLKNYKLYFAIITVIILAFVFSIWLMWHTFSYDSSSNSLLISTRVWSDFAAHIPMIRSFSKGNNLSFEYPIYPGSGMKYHFLFYFFVAILEYIGVRIDFALNILSVFGLSSLITLIFLISYKIFYDVKVSLLSVIFFLLNGSFAFVNFFRKHPLSTSTPTDIIKLVEFPGFAPWGEGDVSAFWNLNIYTNQRHLSFGLALGLLLIFIFLIREKFVPRVQLILSILSGLVISTFIFLHRPMYLVILLIFGTYFFLIPKSKKYLFTMALACILTSLLQFPFLIGQSSTISFYPGYLIHNEIFQMTFLATIFRLLEYWLYNIGLHIFLIPIGYFFLSREKRKIFYFLIPLFIIPNLFKFSVEVAASHKFFNIFMIFGNMISAYLLVEIAYRACAYKNYILKGLSIILSIALIIPLTFSGILDLFVVINDRYIVLNDIKSNEVASFIYHNTDPKSIFITSSYLYNPASISGRKIFLGWPYFAWSAGYDTEKRMKETAVIYQTENLDIFCKIIVENNITYVTYEIPPTIEGAFPHEDFIRTEFPLVFENTQKNYRIYDVRQKCQN